MTTPILSIQQLTKRFDEQDAVHDINLDIRPGEIVAVKGRPGSGKTTLLKLSAGMLEPTSGTVKLDGKTLLSTESDYHGKIGLFFQEHGVYSRLTVKQYLTYFQKLYNVPSPRVEEVINLAGLIDRRDMKLDKAAASFIARVKLARTILHRPMLLLLDEPTTNLDIETTQILRRLIVAAAEEGSAVLLATTTYEESASLASRTAIMNKGRIDSWEDSADNMQSSIDSKQDSAPMQHTEKTLPVQDLANETVLQNSGDIRLKFEKIPARVNDRIILFNPLELIYIESQQGQSLLHTVGESLPCPLTLSELEERLKPFGFFRPHRSYIVNLQHVREVIPWTRNSYSLILADEQKTSIPLSKNSIKELEGIIGI